MKKIVLVAVLMISTALTAAEWGIKPKLYSRGGFTQSSDLDRRGNTDLSVWNPGSWGGESNAFTNNLTEVDLHATYGKKAKIVYGVNIDKSTRFIDNEGKEVQGDSNFYKERQAYIEFYDAIGKGKTIWVGRRPYRGYGDYLTGSFPLDERNMFGAGAIIENVGPGKYEVAYGINDENDSGTETNDNFTTNFLINKYILPIDNGNITFNGEIHQNNSNSDQHESYGVMVGAQYARWNMSFLGAKWYNIFVLNYSNGYLGGIEAGMMSSAYASKDKDERPSKVLFKMGGDIKHEKWSMFYNLRYQWHMGNIKDANDKTYNGQNWQFVDIMARPMYALTSNVGLGVDFVQRVVVKEPGSRTNDAIGWDPSHQNMWRAGLVTNYHLHPGGENIFENAEVSLIIGHVHQQSKKTFYQGSSAKNDEQFVRLKYTMQI